jgi:acid phosphatase family membrane protein YuiD
MFGMDGFFREYTLFIPIVAWAMAIFGKAIVLLVQRKFEISRVFGSGGMPSLHSTLVTSIATAIGIRNGIWSEQFAFALVFASIVIYDAINVRYEV